VQANRRQFLGALGTAALAGCGGARSDGPYPSRDITFVIPVGAGGGADIYARLVGAAIERHTPTSVNVVPTNVPSGGGGKGVVELFRAKADGYTIGILNIPGIFVLERMRKVPYDFRRFKFADQVRRGPPAAFAKTRGDFRHHRPRRDGLHRDPDQFADSRPA